MQEVSLSCSRSRQDFGRPLIRPAAPSPLQLAEGAEREKEQRQHPAFGHQRGARFLSMDARMAICQNHLRPSDVAIAVTNA
jgi:hypothetical protein